MGGNAKGVGRRDGERAGLVGHFGGGFIVMVVIVVVAVIVTVDLVGRC